MGKPSFTQAAVKRAIAAAQKAGLVVTGVRADGTVLVENALAPLLPADDERHAAEASRWGDGEA